MRGGEILHSKGRLWAAAASMILVLLSVVAPAKAHTISLVAGGSKLAPTGHATILVANEGMENDGCTTMVTATLIKNNGVLSVSPASTTYVSPPTNSTFITVTALKNGTEQVRINWTANGNYCNGNGNRTFTFEVEGGQLRLTKAGTDNSFSFGDPVSLATGELHHPFGLRADLFLGGPLPLAFARYYGAFLTAEGFDGDLSNGWMHNFNVSLAVDGSDATVRLFGGKTITFERVEFDWRLSSDEKLGHQLQEDEGGKFRFLDLSTTRIYSFDNMGRLTGVADRNGNTITVTQGPNGPTMAADGRGRSIEFTYTGGRLTKVADQTGREVRFSYSQGNLTTVTHANGQTTTYAYTTKGDLPGLITTTTLPDGTRPARQIYDADGRVESQTDGAGNVARFEYDQAPGKEGSELVDALGRRAQFVHAGGRNLTSTTDAAGNADTAAYDSKNRLSTYIDRLGNRARFTYHGPSGFLASVTDPTGAVWRMDHVMQEQDGFLFYVPTKLTFPDGASEVRAYDDRGNLVTFTDRGGDEWSFAYDEHGQLISLTNPLGGTTTYKPNADGSLAETVSAGGVKKTFEYDRAKRIRTIGHAGGVTRTLAIDDSDNITEVVNELGHATRLEFDDNGRVVKVTDPLGASRSFTYDDNGRVASLTDRTGATGTVQYDAVGNVSEVRNRAGEAVRFNYDDRNLLSSIADDVGTSVEYEYDANGNLTAVTDALEARGEVAHDRAGRVTSLTAPEGGVTNFKYDRVGRLTSIEDPTGQVRRFQYDAQGNISSVGVGEVNTRYQFNALRGLTSVTDPNGGVWRRGYDPGGRQVSLTDPLSRTIEYRYDDRGRRNAIVTPLGEIDRTYDAAGQITRATFFDGVSHDFTHDKNNQLLTTTGVSFVRDAEGRIVNSNGLLIEYDAAGRIQKITYASGKAVTYDYDSRGRLVEVSDWAGGSMMFTYDAADQRTRIQRANGVATDFTYDRDHELSGVQHSNSEVILADIALERDAAGRITSETVDLPLDAQPAPGELALGYDAAHQATDSTYDGLGRLLSDRWRQYRWDGNSTLTGYRGIDGSADFTYDGLGNPISRTTSAGVKNYLLNHAHPLPTVSIVRSGDADSRYYVYEPNGRLLWSIEAAGNAHRYYHFDQNGTTIMLTDDGGTMTDAYATTPFGEEVLHEGDSDQPFVFHGAFGVMWERGTTLYNMRRRSYDAAAARFLSRDPVALLDPLGVNPYQFAFNQPLRFADPSGLKPFFLGDASTSPGVAGGVNRLWGDWNWFNLDEGRALGDNLVAIEAFDEPGGGGVNASGSSPGYTFYSRYASPGGPAGDNREPLGTTWGTRYLNGGVFDSTRLNVWRDTDPSDALDPTGDDGLRGMGTIPEFNPAAIPNNERFKVTADWATPGNDLLGGSNLGVDTTTDACGSLFFFNPDNWELLIKVLDTAGGFNQHSWVFYGATTNVEFTLTVTDTAAGETKGYDNPLGNVAPAVTDTSAFATCP